jgi:uncharacterized membrane protein YgdD (TMEM256/DUF423 family)
LTLVQRRILVAGALLAAFAVALGAFGTHALRDTLGARELGWWQTAVQYQIWHALALLVLAAAPLARPGLPALFLGFGAVFFAGSLYLMALTGLAWLGAVAPVGGTLIIAAWLLLAWRASSSGVGGSSSG